MGATTKKQALEAGKKFLARTGSKLHCANGLCYIGHKGIFPCTCAEKLAKMPD